MPSPARSALRRELLLLLVSIVVLDVVALAARHFLRLETMGGTANVAFTGGWMVATLLVVLPRLSRIRRIRDEARRNRLRS